MPVLDVPVSLVGGVVRDALLGIDHVQDIDLVVEGDALDLATRLGRLLSARVVTHGRFGTAVVELPHAAWIDVVTARKEVYPHPGALPEVSPGTLDDDLARRDFSINAMAYWLSGPRAGALVDPLGGRDDLDARLVRILHRASFVDDPTRVIRAVRYAARLGFALDGQTQEAARAAAPTLDPTSARVGDELRRLFTESAEVTASAVAQLAALGVPWLTGGSDELARRFTAIDDALGRPGAVSIPAWPLRIGIAVNGPAVDALAIDGWARGLAAETSGAPALTERLSAAPRASARDLVLRRARPGAVVVALADGAEQVAEWWRATRTLKPAITGEDLVAAGVSPGPQIGAALAAVRAALLDGDVANDRAAQLALAMAQVGGAV